MADIPAIKAANDAAVTNKSSMNSLSPADEGGRLNAITDELQPCKIYTGVINQIGNDDPVVDPIHINTLGGVPVWTRLSAGDYTITLVGAFLVGKVQLYLSTGEEEGLWSWERLDDDTIDIVVPNDNVFTNGSIRIEVYP